MFLSEAPGRVEHHQHRLDEVKILDLLRAALKQRVVRGPARGSLRNAEFFLSVSIAAVMCSTMLAGIHRLSGKP